MQLLIIFLVYLTTFLFFVLSISTVYGSRKVNRNELFSKALGDIVRSYYLKNNLRIDFVIANKACSSFANEIITNNLRHNSHIIGPVTMNSFEESKTVKFNLTRSSVIFIDRSSISERLMSKLNMKNTDYMRFHHYVLFKEEFLDLI